MGVLTGSPRVMSAGTAQGAYSIGTSSYPVTGFPLSAYRGANLSGGGGVQGQPSTIAGAFSNNAVQLDNKTLVIVVAIVVVVGYTAWHLDNKR